MKQNTVSIEALENRRMLATFAVINAGDAGAGSLRQSILDANVMSGTDTITFNIPGSGVHTISPATALPTITDAVTIDGTTQPGATSGAPLIEINGSNAGISSNGISISNVDATIKGLAINRFNNLGIFADALAHAVTIQTCYIGVDPAGLIARPNLGGGINFIGSNGLIGGSQVGDRNIIGANGDLATGTDDNGITLVGSGNTVRNNFIGVGANLTAVLGNANFGILVGGLTSNNTIVGNIIANSGRAGVGVTKTVTGTEITNNAIYGNGGLGIDLMANASTEPGDGITPNDDDDPDIGGNNVQNFPVISTVQVLESGGKLHLAGTLNSTPSHSFRLEFYSSRDLQTVDQGEGANAVGQLTVSTNASGDATFDATFSGSFSTLSSIAATATDTATHDTSEFSAPTGALYFAGTGGNDTITFAAAAGNDIILTINGVSQTIEGTALNFLGIDAGDGNDSVTIAASLRAVYVLGGAGRDTLTGGDSKDTLTGGAQTDFINGGAGDDRLNGSGGHDSIDGGLGNDRLYGNEGFDTLIGSAGVDRGFGGEGNDSLVGNGSNDKLYGEDGDDSLVGNDGDDILHGDDGLDNLLGGDGNDTMDGDASSDTLDGGAGNDFMGGSGGNDVFTGGVGLDTMLGGTGNDRFGAEDNEVDSLNGGSGSDSGAVDASLDIVVSVETKT